MSRNPVGVGNSLVLLPRVARGSQPWALRRNPVGIEFRNATPFKFVKLRFLSQDECRLSSKLTCELTLPPPLPRRTARFREFAGQTTRSPGPLRHRLSRQRRSRATPPANATISPLPIHPVASCRRILTPRFPLRAPAFHPPHSSGSGCSWWKSII